MHCFDDKVSVLPPHLSDAVVLNATDIVVGVVLVVVSHPLQVLSHAPGPTSVSHKPLVKITLHNDSCKVFDFPLQRCVVVLVVVLVLVVVVLVVKVLVDVVLLVEVVDVMVLVLVEVVKVVLVVLEVVDVDVVDVLVVVSQPLHVLSH